MGVNEPRYLGDTPSQPRGPDYMKPESTVSRSKRHEKGSASRSGKRLTPGSGNRATSKRAWGAGNSSGCPGDLVGETDLGELKTTKKTDTRIQLSWLRKIAYEALTQGKTPYIEMQFDKLEPPCPKEWVLITAARYDELLEIERENR